MHQDIIDMKVRDYECDAQGIVNNAVYLNYFEHARHEWLQKRDLNFNEYVVAGLHLVVVRMEIDYKSSLVPSAHFYVVTNAKLHSRVRLIFRQSIYLQEDDKLIAQAKTHVTGMDKNGKLLLPESIIKTMS